MMQGMAQARDGQERFEVERRTVTVRTAGAGGPAVYLQVFMGDGQEVWGRLHAAAASPLTLVTVGNLNWDDDMSPWECPPLTRDDVPCAGKADQHLARLLDDIVPRAEAVLPAPPAYRALAGYSLAGLFAVCALFQTDCFARVASASGSLWFPGFVEYARQHAFAGKPACCYLSLGRKEHKTPNRLLRSVRDNTQAFDDILEQRGVPHVFELNSGNHYQDGDVRMARGISWMLAQ